MIVWFSGILELNLDRPGSKNAIGKDMLRGLQHNLEIINKDLSAKVLMLSSAVPKVFCAGADLKVGLTLCRQLCSFTELLHQKSVCHCC